ncbi:MAG: proline dehydrogenase family protein [Deltaproteobacteria bacterium]|nr:proline dehydrogenase family protein [Deltaproteobacteria bacterium]
MRRLLAFFAKRYIAGIEIKNAIEAARRLNSLGILATIDNLGENVSDIHKAKLSVREYHRLLEEIDKAKVKSTVSLKLTHLGLDISEDLARANAESILRKAMQYGNSVCLDMEGSGYTKRTIDICLSLRKDYPNVSIAIQSYLKRSAADITLLNKNSISVRLVKGAYKEPPEIAFADKKDVDANYEALMKELLLHGNRPAIATHDERLINEAIRFANDNAIGKESFEFQMLLGIKRGLQKRLADESFKMRVYVPYGAEWLPYTLRRFRERKENIYFVLKNIFD